MFSLAIDNFIYRGIAHFARGITMAQGLQIHASGVERIPDTGGAVMVYNHTGYMDFVFGGFLPREKKRLVRYMTKSSIFDKPGVKQLMLIMRHIPVDRIDGSASVDKAIETARAGELVGIFPEGTISRSFEIRRMRTGAVRIAHAAGVPIIPTVIFGSQRLWTKGHKKNLGRTNTPIFIKALEPFYPSGDPEADTAELRHRLQEGVEGLWKDYEVEYGPMPKGEYWVPARLGGGAPTLEEAQRLDRAKDDERYRVRRLRDDLADLTARVRAVATEIAQSASGVADSAKQKVAGIEPDTMEWIRDNLTTVVEEANRGLEEGRDKIAEVTAQAKGEISRIHAGLTSGGKGILADSRLEQALVAAATQARIINTRLPHRAQATFGNIPRAIIVDAPLSERAIDALRQLSPDTSQVVLVGPDAVELARVTEMLPQQVRGIAKHEGLTAELDNMLAELGIKPAEAMMFLGSDAATPPAGVCTVALETAPYPVLRNAQAVTYGPEKEGVAEVLELILKLHSR